jgi:hypothetical protein
MIDSDWVVMGLVVIGQQGPPVGDVKLPLELDGGGQGEQPLADADEHPPRVQPPHCSKRS